MTKPSDLPYRDGPHQEVELRQMGRRHSVQIQREIKMDRCNCRLCYLCLNPPRTFAIYQSHGLDKIGKESSARVYGNLPNSRIKQTLNGRREE